ncbi:TRAPP trafficking subunit Trs65-domain-containing protein [Ampelomyces quisqualis]|uniref:TRAPP trafficking subunit Trs65-domain-containing protein n=1 Tax=Ampelomyces quisqualis TaxID=50730 RepID=A0A6A5QH43_AMPQU|nr:TRAPP trafficking subunit Trs65-domain-containing protein [Ampelomyces quisqualis]
MASSPGAPKTRSSAEFVESSVLEAIVPAKSDVNVEEELRSWNGTVEDESGSILPTISQRTVLLLDEQLSVHVVFRTPLLDDAILRSYLARLVLNLEAYAFSTGPPPEGEPKAGPTKELIFSTTIKDTEQPSVVRHGEGEGAQTFVMWKVEAFIARPQGRFHKPAVYFQPMASFKPASTPKRVDPEDEYLPSRVPTALNLLQAFENDPALTGVHPRLSAMRINKIAPSATSVVKEMVRPIRSGQRPLFRVLPSLIWRVRYARVHASLSDLSLLVSLDLEVASYATYDVRIKKVDLTLHGGEVTPFANIHDPQAVHKPGDQITYLYKIRPDVGADGTPALGDKGHYLTMTVSAQVLMSPTCHPNISIDWKTPVDFTSATEQSASMLKTAHRLSTPPTAQAPSPDGLPAYDTQPPVPNDTTPNTINMTLTISGPPTVTVGDTFTWTVFITNRSPQPRNLAVLVIPRRNRHSDKPHHHPRPSTAPSTTAAAPAPAEKHLLAAAVVDENVVYAQQKSARTETADLVCLTTDIRLGPLASGACYTADVEFLALGTGVLGVESVRVVDLGTNQSVDVREVPGVICVAKEV